MVVWSAFTETVSWQCGPFQRNCLQLVVPGLDRDALQSSELTGSNQPFSTGIEMSAMMMSDLNNSAASTVARLSPTAAIFVGVLSADFGSDNFARDNQLYTAVLLATLGCAIVSYRHRLSKSLGSNIV